MCLTHHLTQLNRRSIPFMVKDKKEIWTYWEKKNTRQFNQERLSLLERLEHYSEAGCELPEDISKNSKKNKSS